MAPRTPLVVRLRCQFPFVDEDVVVTVLESAAGGRLVSAEASASAPAEAVEVLRDLQADALAARASAGAAVDAGITSVRLAAKAAALDGGGPAGSFPAQRGPWSEAGLNGGLQNLGVVGRVGSATLRVDVDMSLRSGAVSTPPMLTLAVPAGEVWPLAWHEPPLLLRPPSYGWYRLSVAAPGGEHAELCFKVSSVVAEHAEALDNFFDALAWAWDGANWTDELADATMELVVRIDDFLTKLNALLGPILSMLGDPFRSLLDAPRRQLETQLGKVLDQHDVTAVGMTHTALRELLHQVGMLGLMGPMMGAFAGSSGGGISGVAAALSESASSFERARQAACGGPALRKVQERISELLATGRRYIAHVREAERSGANMGSSSTLARQWDGPEGLAAKLQRMEGEHCFIDLTVALALLGNGAVSMLADVLGRLAPAGGGGACGVGSMVVQSMPSIDAGALLGSNDDLHNLVARWSEDLVGGVAMVGSPVRPMRLSTAPADIDSSVLALDRLMRLGFGYVAQGEPEPDAPRPEAPSASHADGMLMAVLDRSRATLPLRAQAVFLSDRRRRARLRDVARVLRSQRRQGRRFALRVNSDLPKAVSMLREHHEDSWVGPVLEGVWTKMVGFGRLLVFELWLLEEDADAPEGPGAKLIAADFGHPHSTFGFYVATRFFDRAYKTCMPGFILAFAEAELLAKRGFDFWDLGGVNSSPMMAYKPQVALEMRREMFLDLLAATRRRELAGAAAPPGQVAAGTAVAEIVEDDLWGWTADSASPQPKPKATLKVPAKAPKAPPRPAAGRQWQAGADASQAPCSAAGPAAWPTEAGTMRVRFQRLFAELREQGFDATGAAAEALRRLSQQSRHGSDAAAGR